MLIMFQSLHRLLHSEHAKGRIYANWLTSIFARQGLPADSSALLENVYRTQEFLLHKGAEQLGPNTDNNLPALR